MKHFLMSFCAALVLALPTSAQVVDYDAPPLTIAGVQLLQDANDPLVYYYLPQYPRLSRNDAGDLEILMMNIVRSDDADPSALGGIFHALIEFGLPEETVADVTEGLAERVPGAVLAGALPLLEPSTEEGTALGSFRVVSAVLSSDADSPNGRVLKSGPAPLRAGSKAAIAARLTTEEAVVLRDSLEGSTADLSVSVRGYYEAQVRGYNAIVTASSETIYSHESFVDSVQSGYSKRQIRDIVDDLVQDNVISVEVFDRAEALGIDSGDLDKILDIVTDKLIEVVFDTQTGWSQVPPPEIAVAEDQIKGRLEQGWLQKTFLNDEDRPYYTDDQYVIKDVENRRAFSFRLDLSRSTTIRVPIDTTGNLGGFYSALTDTERDRHFRIIVPETDAAIQTKEVLFQVDGQIADGFGDNFNAVSVNLRHGQADGTTRTASLIFTPEMVTAENGIQTIALFREGNDAADWATFEYQVAWDLRGSDALLRSPTFEDDWNTTADGIVALTPPLTRKEIDIDVDTTDFLDQDIFAVEIQIASTLMGTVQFLGESLQRARETDPGDKLVLWHDEGEDVAWRAIWHTRQGRAVSNFQIMDGNYLFIFAPDPLWLQEAVQ